MPEPKKTKGGGDDDGRTSRGFTEEPVNEDQGGSKEDEQGKKQSGTGGPAEEHSHQNRGLGPQSHLSIEEKVNYINQLYGFHFGKAPIIIGIWAFVNVLDSDIEAARSKSPKKKNPMRLVCDNENLHPDLKGPTLRRYVSAALTDQELERHGVDTSRLEYSHLREISKIPKAKGRETVARQVVAEKLTVKATIALVQAELEKERSTEPHAESEFCGLAQAVIDGLDNPASLSEDESLSSILLDSTQACLEFNFPEQASIYNKAKKVMKTLHKEKRQLEERMEPVQRSINFLEDVVAAFNQKATKSQAQA